jgi:hypothetical protein
MVSSGESRWYIILLSRCLTKGVGGPDLAGGVFCGQTVQHDEARRGNSGH